MTKHFLTQSIFNNYAANNFFDEITSHLLSERYEFPDDFALTGRAAYELQRPTNTELKNVIFVTWNIDHYLKIASILERYNVKELIKYKEKLLFRYQAGTVNLCVEIHFYVKEQNTISYNGITLIAINSIPNELLL